MRASGPGALHGLRQGRGRHRARQVVHRLAVVACLMAAPPVAAPAFAQTSVTVLDGYIMGAGRWTCEEALTVARGSDASRIGQLAGWILGTWSRATAEHGRAFTDQVEATGGRGLYEATLQACNTAPGAMKLYQVTFRMIAETAGRK
jgi:hypothetical protein